MVSAAEDIARKLKAKRTANGWIAKCPAHDDQRESLAIGDGENGKLLLHCFAGCSFDQILKAAGIEPTKGNGEDHSKPRIVATYDYCDASGELLYQVVRLAPKGFRQRRPDGNGGWIWGRGDTPDLPYRLPHLLDASHVYVVEGEKDADRLAGLGLVATTNPKGAGRWPVGFARYFEGRHAIIIPDNDQPGRDHAQDVAQKLKSKAASIRILELPDLPPKGDVCDWLAAAGTRERLEQLAATAAHWKQAAAPQPSRQYSLAEVHAVFRRWLGDEYDISTLNAVLATAAAEKLLGDPLWLLVISGPGNAKTETVQSMRGAGAHVTSTITSEGALLSASSKRDRTKDATGGLLRKIGDRGLLVIKDITSILSGNRDVRSSVLAAMREVYDGRWERNVGTDGGRTLTWEGRIGVIGAVTTAWDSAHSVISTMGDRFVLIRADSHSGRCLAGRRAIQNTGQETAMRQEMADAVGGLIAAVDSDQHFGLTDDEVERILQAADIVTLARTGVEFDYRGEVIDAHAPEMPTRFAKQLTQMLRGSVAIGMDRADALALALRGARDSIPPMRLELLLDVGQNPGSRVIDIRRRVEKPRMTVDRQLQALHILRLLVCDETEEERLGKTVHVRHYSLAPGINMSALPCPEMSPHTHRHTKKERGETSARTSTDIFGHGEFKCLAPETQPNDWPDAPPIGTIEDGYRYVGGDPAEESSWRAVQ